MNKPNKTELEYFIRYSLDSDKYKRYMELYDEIERLNKCYCNRSDCAGRLNQKNEVYDSVVQRNEKAIEYMERYMFSQKENYDYIHLSDILKGVDK